jgi:hypothetical protein
MNKKHLLSPFLTGSALSVLVLAIIMGFSPSKRMKCPEGHCHFTFHKTFLADNAMHSHWLLDSIYNHTIRRKYRVYECTTCGYTFFEWRGLWVKWAHNPRSFVPPIDNIVVLNLPSSEQAFGRWVTENGEVADLVQFIRYNNRQQVIRDIRRLLEAKGVTGFANSITQEGDCIQAVTPNGVLSIWESYNGGDPTVKLQQWKPSSNKE